MSLKTIETMIDWVEENIKAEPSLKKMSDYVGYSSFYCSAKFHEAVGMSFKEYVIRRKLSLAAADLRNTNLKILEVALKYGFSSHEAFTRAFCKYFGCTPRQYRKLSAQVSGDDKRVLLSVAP